MSVQKMGNSDGKRNKRQKQQAKRRRKRRLFFRRCVLFGSVFLLAAAGYGVMRKNNQSRTTVRSGGGYASVGVNGRTAPLPSEDEWYLILVNPWNALPESYSVTSIGLRDGQAVDERCYPDLQEMMDDCRATGLNPLIQSSYRSHEYQERLFAEEVNLYLRQGYARAEAEAKAAAAVAIPGTSEHELGLALDIVDRDWPELNERQADTPVQKWLMENSWRYGFILRYPVDKSEITGIMYEPWHYRYVGREAAKEIYEKGLCLEEYLGLTK